VVNPIITTTFDPIDPICEGDSNPLPTTDINGVTGSWTPAFDATTTTDYSFTPDPGQCATTPAPVQVVVNPIITTTFDPIDPICEGDSNPLPTTDINGVTGNWTPAFDATTTTDYSFTPDPGQCATTPAPVQVVVNPIVTPAFDSIDPICAGDSIAPLPTTSNNGITGTWNPATIDNTTTDVYTFTPDAGVCVIPTTIEITVLQQITPTFLIDDICIGESTAQLPVVSEENISGSWSPATVNNLVTTTYTFTPDPGQCANTTTETINVNPINTLSIATENTSTPFDSNQIIEVTVTGGSGNYEYQLDGGIWQNSPVFQNVIGCQEHIVKVRDEEGCSNEPESVVTILSYPKFFTPNGDGYNDFWNIECLKNRTGLISIFDRFGKLLKQFKTTSSGWNGSYNDALMPTSDYWFMVRYFDENGLEKEFRSHFTLRR
jgi:gliding motility-associated-like protein